MTPTYGETAADKTTDDNSSLVWAALDGDRDALRALLAETAQSSYVAGYGAAASVMGVAL